MRSVAATSAAIATLSMSFPVAAFPFFDPVEDWFDDESYTTDRDDYEDCTRDLLQAEIPAGISAAACASVIRPEELGECVEEIDRDILRPEYDEDDPLAVRINASQVSPLDVLSACRQVRRPTDLAECVVDIGRKTIDPNLPLVLDRCRRSLLPERFGNCVVGVSDALNIQEDEDVIARIITAEEAMDVCLDTGDVVRDIYPTIIPFDGGLIPEFDEPADRL